MRRTFAAAALALVTAATLAAAQQTPEARPPAGSEVLDLDEALEQSSRQQSQPQQQQEAQQALPGEQDLVVGEPAPERRLGAIAVDALEGSKVISPAGEALGKIEKVVIDPGYGRITYAIIEVGGFLGVGEREVAVPWPALRPGREDDAYILDSTREQLANAPAIDDDKIARITDLDLARSVHAYYGQRPYWDDGAPQQAEAPGR